MEGVHTKVGLQVNMLMHTFCSLHTFSAFQMRQTTGEIQSAKAEGKEL